MSIIFLSYLVNLSCLFEGRLRIRSVPRSPAERRVDSGVQLQPLAAHRLFQNLRDDLQLLQVLLEGLHNGKTAGGVSVTMQFSELYIIL